MGGGGQFGGDDELGWHFAEQQEDFGQDQDGNRPIHRGSFRPGHQDRPRGRFQNDIEDRDYFRAEPDGGPRRPRPPFSGPREGGEGQRDFGPPGNLSFRDSSRAMARRDRPLRREDTDDERRSADWARSFPPTRAERAGDFDELPDDRRAYGMYAGREYPWEEDRYTERADDRRTEDDEYSIGFSPGSAGYDGNDEDENRYFSGRGRRQRERRTADESTESRARPRRR